MRAELRVEVRERDAELATAVDRDHTVPVAVQAPMSMASVRTRSPQAVDHSTQSGSRSRWRVMPDWSSRPPVADAE